MPTVGQAGWCPCKDRLAVRAGQDADGGAWFAATDPLRLWPPKTRVVDIHFDVIDVVNLTPFIEVRTDDFKRAWSDHCCTVDIYTYYGSGRGALDGGAHLQHSVDAASFSLKASWHALDFSSSGHVFKNACADEEAAAMFTMPDLMAPLAHYRFVVNDLGTESPSGRPGPVRVGWSRLAADWAVYAMRGLGSLLDPEDGGKTGYGEISYMGEVDFYEVAEHFIYIGEDGW